MRAQLTAEALLSLAAYLAFVAIIVASFTALALRVNELHSQAKEAVVKDSDCAALGAAAKLPRLFLPSVFEACLNATSLRGLAIEAV